MTVGTREVTVGVLLGLAGGALVEVVKSIEATNGTDTVIFLALALTSVLLATALARLAQPLTVTVYVVPLALIGLTGTLALLGLLVTFVPTVGCPHCTGPSPQNFALTAQSLFLLAGAILALAVFRWLAMEGAEGYGPMIRWFQNTRLVSRVSGWLGSGITRQLVVAAGVVAIIGLIFELISRWLVSHNG